MKLRHLLLLLFFIGPPIRAQDLVVDRATVYASPAAPAIQNATIVTHSGKIAKLTRHPVAPKKNATVVHCDGCVVCAGFWNTHMHFTEPKWNDAAHARADRLATQLQEMLTHSGFTSVVDTGSVPANTTALRRRIESGEIPGPRIYTAGGPLPDACHPVLPGRPSPRSGAQLGQPETEADVHALAERNLAYGADLVKFFTGSYVGRGTVVTIKLPIARRAVEDAHRHGEPVFAHPSNAAGIRVAIDSGVDVLAHAPIPPTAWTMRPVA